MRRLLPGACLFRAFGSAAERDAALRHRVDRAVTAKTMQPDPVEAAAKLVSLEGSSHLCFYATSLPLAIGQGASHVLPWSAGDQVLISDPSFSTTHLLVLFESQSRTYELKIVGETGAKVDGYDYKKGAVVRLGSGSCVKVGGFEFCVLLPQQPRGAAPAARAIPALPGAGTLNPCPLPLVAVAVQALRETPNHCLSLGEIEQYIRRVYPHVAKGTLVSDGKACASWRAELEEELRKRPNVCVCRGRQPGERGVGEVWCLSQEAAAAAAQQAQQRKSPPAPQQAQQAPPQKYPPPVAVAQRPPQAAVNPQALTPQQQAALAQQQQALMQQARLMQQQQQQKQTVAAGVAPAAAAAAAPAGQGDEARNPHGGPARGAPHPSQFSQQQQRAMLQQMMLQRQRQQQQAAMLQQQQGQARPPPPQ